MIKEQIIIEKVQATSNISLTELSTLINEVYSSSEYGLWKEEYTRVNPNNLKKMIMNKEIILATDKYSQKILGVINFSINLLEKSCFWGMLAVDKKYRELAIGRRLIAKVEELAKIKNINIIQFDLLKPLNWKHPEKEKLEKWYQGQGYEFEKDIEIENENPDLISHLDTKCKFLRYRKKFVINKNEKYSCLSLYKIK